MAITAAEVKALRESTGAGMMDCKKALEAAGGDMDAAKKVLRERGLADVDKRAGRSASEGLVEAVLAPDGTAGVLVEVVCETDFVAIGERFGRLAKDVAEALFGAATAEPAGEVAVEVERLLEDAAVELREKLEFRRGAYFATTGGVVDAYLHRTGGWAKKGVLIQIDGDADSDSLSEAAHEIALHIQFARPDAVTRSEIPEDVVDTERDVAAAKARNEGKSEEIVPKIVEGAVKKMYKQRVLAEQPFVKDDKKSVSQWLEQATGGRGTVARFARFEIGEAQET